MGWKKRECAKDGGIAEMATTSDPAGGRAAEPARCPLCGGPNGCALAVNRPIDGCWCAAKPIPQRLLDRIPPERRGRACICAACAARG